MVDFVPISLSKVLTTRRHLIGLLIVLICATAFRLVTLDRPFDYDPEATGSFYGILAHNYHRLAWTETYGMPALTVGRPPNAPITLYHDHPPVVPLLIFPFYALFGFGEWQTRIATSIASIAAILALYMTLERFGSRQIALISAACFAATPMNLYYGGQPEVTGMPLVLFAICSVWAYLRFCKNLNSTNLMVLVGVFALAGATDWPAFILVPIFSVHFLTTEPRHKWIWILIFCLAGTAVFVLVYVYIKFAADIPWDWMLQPFLNRSGMGGVKFTSTQWIETAIKFNVNLHTIPLLLTALLGLITLSWRGAKAGGMVAWLLLAWGTAHVLVGRQGVYIHEWWWWPLTPGIATASGLWLDWFVQKTQKFVNPRALNVALGAALLIFAAWTTQSTYSALYPYKAKPFTAAELGEAIRAAAPKLDDVALLVWGGHNPQDYFYGNRPLRDGIWSVEDLQARLWDENVDLPFGYQQHWSGPATGIVFPLVFRERYFQLLDYLERHYREVLLERELAKKFRVFSLCDPCANALEPTSLPR
jgi:4-amino-4-deoxy-L-arabinose transferase-like glycosyltransferase